MNADFFLGVLTGFLLAQLARYWWALAHRPVHDTETPGRTE
jgi:hypothetical protein